MKKHLLILPLVLCYLFSAKSQSFSLWGMTEGGGSKALGNIFKYNPGAMADSDAYDFGGWYGANPYGSLVKASDGLLYGMSQQGGPGTQNDGVLFNFDPVSGTFNAVFNFDSVHGEFPTGSLIQATDGQLYGMTYNGGNKQYGVIFSYNITTGKDSVVLYFDSTHGRWPNGTLLQAKDSLLYGLTNGGGPLDDGVLFSFNIKTGQEKVLVNLTGTNGAWPIGDLVQAPNGILYGMTNIGGSANKGVLFSYNPVTAKDSVKVNFTGANGQWPYGNVTVAWNGLLYGTTQAGGAKGWGTIFSFNTSTNKYTVLTSFDSAKQGAYLPIGTMVQAPNGLLYGMTNSGGPGNNGAIFQFNTMANKDSVDTYFNGVNGQLPQFGSLIVLGGPTAINNITATQEKTCIYPNPFNESATIGFGAIGKHYLDVLDITGKQLFTVECKGMQYELSKGALANGVYFVRVRDEQNHLVSISKVIVE